MRSLAWLVVLLLVIVWLSREFRDVLGASTSDVEPYLLASWSTNLSGTAKSYTASPTTADYTTRMLVRRPADPKKFNGTVIVEWNNVTAQHDSCVGQCEH